MDLFNIKGKKIEKLLEEKGKIQKELDYYAKTKKPKLVNNGKKRENFIGTTSCERCTKRTSFDTMLLPGESTHVFCSECEKEFCIEKSRLKEIDVELQSLGYSSKTTSTPKTQNKPMTLTLNNKNNKRR